jgi:hypothetical protein
MYRYETATGLVTSDSTGSLVGERVQRSADPNNPIVLTKINHLHEDETPYIADGSRDMSPYREMITGPYTAT